MLLHILAWACAIASTVATEGTSTFFPPLARSFISIDFFVGWPVNATVPSGLVAVTPNAAGTITGAFDGYVVENTTASVERFPSADTGSAVYSVSRQHPVVFFPGLETPNTDDVT